MCHNEKIESKPPSYNLISALHCPRSICRDKDVQDIKISLADNMNLLVEALQAFTNNSLITSVDEGDVHYVGRTLHICNDTCV